MPLGKLFNLPKVQFLNYNTSTMVVPTTQACYTSWKRGWKALYRACHLGRAHGYPYLLSTFSKLCPAVFIQIQCKKSSSDFILYSLLTPHQSHGHLCWTRAPIQGLGLLLLLSACSATHLGHIFVQKLLSLLYLKITTPSIRPSRLLSSHSAFCLSFSA